MIMIEFTSKHSLFHQLLESRTVGFGPCGEYIDGLIPHLPD